jgi:hypothetical protein
VWSLDKATITNIRSVIDRLKPAIGVPAAENAIHSLISTKSVETTAELMRTYEFLSSGWVIQIFSKLKSEALAADDKLAAHNFSITIMALAFSHDAVLRKHAKIPASLKADFDRWSSLRVKAISKMSEDELDECVKEGGLIVKSPFFADVPEILQRDINLDTGEALVYRLNSKWSKEDLDSAIHFLSEATSLSPRTSPAYARSTTFGGISLLNRHLSTLSMDDLSLAIEVLREAVNVSQYTIGDLNGQATSALTDACMRRFYSTGDFNDLRLGADSLVIGIRHAIEHNAKVSENTATLAFAVSDELRKKPEEMQRLQALTSALGYALQHEGRKSR